MSRDGYPRSLLPVAVCALCGAPAPSGLGLCPGCTLDLPELGAHCPCCAVPFAAGDYWCAPCTREPPPFSRSFAPFQYRPPLDYLVQGMKFGQRLDYARVLGGLLAAFIQRQDGDRPQLLLPVPLHPRRLRERGYNQALEIARVVARRLRIAVDARCCTRRRATAAQTSLGAAARRHNVAGAFVLRYVPAAAHVAVVDDVMTTGSTAAELAALLRRAGVARVDVWVCARAAPGANFP